MPPKAVAGGGKPAAKLSPPPPPAARKPAAKPGTKAGTPARGGGAAKGTAKASKGAKSAPSRKVEPTPSQQEEQQYLADHGNEPLAADPWAALRSAYGGSLSPAECFERLQSLRSTEAVSIDAATLAQFAAGLDPPSHSSLIAQARALDAALEHQSPESAQRVSLAGCGLERVQIGPVLASRTVDLDLSGNPVADIDALAGSCLRGLDASGCRLTRPPMFRNDYSKLVDLNLSFNDLGRLPDTPTMATLSNLRRLCLQNCMLVSIAEDSSAQGPELGTRGRSALASMVHLRDLDLSFNLLANPSEMSLLTCLQRLDVLDVGCNEMCAHADYHSSVKAMRQRIATLKRLNDEQVVNCFVGYGRDAAMEQHEGEARLAGLDRDNSSCSCVEGNPCLSAETCLDFKNRFAVVYKIRMDRFWSKGMNVS